MTEKICLLTGGTDGIGKATALKLHDRGYKVIIVARNKEKAAALVQAVNTFSGGRARLEYLVADLSSLSQVNRMLETVKAKYHRLDVLINNAGIVLPKRTVTADGFETTFQVNYLSPFIITNSLLDLLRESDNGRILNVVSDVYKFGKFDLDNIHGTHRYNPIGAYAASKLYLLLFSEELAARIGEGVTVNALHPGIVRTNMSTQMQNFPFVFKLIMFIAKPFAVAPEKAAEAPVLLATSDTMRHVTGKYFERSKMVNPHSKFNTPGNRSKLWYRSMDHWSAHR
jgi:retinol dehydrogenase 12